MKVPANIEQIEDASMKQIAIQSIRQQIETYTLYYNGEDYAFSLAPFVDDGTSFTIEGNNSVYFNRQDQRKISLKRIVDKLFVVGDTLSRYDWEIKYDESKEVLGQHCVKAVLVGNDDVMAWFCDEIPVQVGPCGYVGLPGLILKLETLSSIYEASEIATVPENVKIALPEGKSISSQEFERIEEKKMKELGASGEGGTVIIVQ